ncbi:MAG TPA: TetR/AcrR family transcriptional regulator [Acidimicrobiales bacterium]|nr:TetR/AcrR family transcriptional regulator [Acidimicrobiales bacterium]
MTAPSDRAKEQRERILRSAQELLHTRGWHGVAVDDIGEASGLTGPAIYRYFPNKQRLLSEALGFALDQLWGSVPAGDHPGLDAYVASHIDFVLENTRLVQLWYREAQNLPPDALRSQRRMQRRYLERWVEALTTERPDLALTEARQMVRAAVALVHSIAHSEARSDRALLHRMAMAALAV